MLATVEGTGCEIFMARRTSQGETMKPAAESAKEIEAFSTDSRFTPKNMIGPGGPRALAERLWGALM